MKIKKSLSAPILALIVYLFTFAARFLDISVLQNYDRDNIYLTIIVLQLLIFVIPGIFYSKLRGTEFVSGLRIRIPSPGRIGIAVLLFFTMLTGSVLLKLLISHFTGSIYNSATALNFRANISAAGLYQVTDAIYTIITFALVPAIAQEFIFRGVLMSEYRVSRYGIWSMVLIPSLLYGMLGFSLQSFPVYFIQGILMSLMVLITDSLLAPMFFSFINNILELYLEDSVLRVFQQSDYFSLLLFLIGSLFLIFIILSFAEAERLTYNDGVSGKKEPQYMITDGSGGKKFSECIFSPTCICCIVLFFASIFFQRYI